jgi:hypothetical protein
MVQDDESAERIQLSAAQIAASSLAAVSAAVVCSFFGVAGTVIGAAIASVLATVGSALYSYSLRRTKARLRRLHQAGAAAPPVTEVMRTAREQGRRLVSQLPVKLIGAGAIGVFIVSIGVVTVIELGLGKPLSALFGVSHSGNRNTSLGSGLDFGSHRSPSKPNPEPTTTPSPGVSSSPTPSAQPTVTRTVTPNPSPTSAAPPTVSPTASTPPTPRLPLPHVSSSHP